jgi:vacuolar-type H+-ATPase subunit E/Vma4
MSGMEKITETILAKVEEEARQIIENANKEALKEVQKAEKQAKTKYDEEKQKVVGDAEREAARVLAQSQIEARQKLAMAKAEIIEKVTANVKDSLEKVADRQQSLAALIKEALDGLDVDKAVVYVSAEDISVAKKVVKAEKTLADRISEIKEGKFNGGAIAETLDGMIRVDNTYDTRLKMLLPRIMPEIEKTLFSDK